MPLSWALFASIALAIAGYIIGRSRAYAAAGDVRALHSRPIYHGASVALTTLLLPLAVLAIATLLRVAGVIGDSSGPIVGVVAWPPGLPGWAGRCRVSGRAFRRATWSSGSSLVC